MLERENCEQHWNNKCATIYIVTLNGKQLCHVESTKLLLNLSQGLRVAHFVCESQ